ncbi:MAG: YDG/SRA domain-containing protein [Candidatus Bathyarchaeia archaeon]
MLLKFGDILSNREISRIFDVCAQRGIRYNGSLQKGIRHIVLITVLHKSPEESLRNPYNDRLEDDILLYTGEGRAGNQKMERGNLALKRQMTEGYPIFVFEKKSPGKYMFLGQYNVLSVNVEIQPDIKGQSREVFVYKLKRASTSVSLNVVRKLDFQK